MSASLVGSEMCIRDSLLLRARMRSRAHARRPRYATLDHAAPRYAVPVSYTHLTLPTICSV
eukprot:14863605-Alexandrium_andersonii.AAC.1